MTTIRQRELREGYIASGHPKIMDELCKCGCYRSQHNRLLGETTSIGYGECLSCGCGEFVWEAFLVKEGPLDIEELVEYKLIPPGIVAGEAVASYSAIAMPVKV